MKFLLTLIALLVAGALSAQSETRQLAWDDPNPAGVVWWFNVYATDQVAPAFWQFEAQVVDNDYAISITGPRRFFTVTAMTADGEVPPIQHD